MNNIWTGTIKYLDKYRIVLYPKLSPKLYPKLQNFIQILESSHLRKIINR